MIIIKENLKNFLKISTHMLVFETFNLISIFKIYQNFYKSNCEIERDKNLEPIYHRSHNPEFN